MVTATMNILYVYVYVGVCQRLGATADVGMNNTLHNDRMSVKMRAEYGSGFCASHFVIYCPAFMFPGK